MVKKRKKIGLLLGSWLVLLLIFYSGNLTAQIKNQAKGIIKGTVINKTLAGGEVKNQEIILQINKDDSEVEKLSIQTSSSGGFEFKNLLTDRAYSYSLSLNYQGGEYLSDTVSFGEERSPIVLNLTVYDSTTSDEKIKVEIDHIIIEKAEKGSLLVSEVMAFDNTGDKTYIGKKSEPSGEDVTLNISLPAGFHDIEYVQGLMECCVRQTKEGILSIMDFEPGQKTVTIRYKLSYSSKSFLLSKLFNYKTTNFYLLAPRVFKISSDNLTSEASLEIDGTPYAVLGLEKEMATGSRITAKISGLPSPGWKFTHITIIGLIASFIVIGLTYPLLKKNKATKDQGNLKRIKPDRDREDLETERKVLLSLIAHLDDQFEKKEIPEHLYREMRREFKEKLVKIMEVLAKMGEKK